MSICCPPFNPLQTRIAELRAELRSVIRRSADTRLLYRLFSVLLLMEGNPLKTVARYLGEHERTLLRWKQRFLEQGVSGLKESSYHGRPTKLPRELRKHLEDDLHRPPWKFGYQSQKWTGKQLQQHLKKHYGVELSERQCQRIMRAARDGHKRRKQTASRKTSAPTH